MKTLGNVIWFIFGGFISALGWFLCGVILCITIIGIPFGRQCFKFAKLVLTPFGKDVSIQFEKHPIMNIIWLILFGWEMFIGDIIIAAIYCITIIGIPFGKQWFKISKLSLFPFGARIK